MGKTKILLVEDNNRLGYMLKEYMEIKGFEVVLAADGAEGLENYIMGSGFQS